MLLQHFRLGANSIFPVKLQKHSKNFTDIFQGLIKILGMQFSQDRWQLKAQVFSLGLKKKKVNGDYNLI